MISKLVLFFIFFNISLATLAQHLTLDALSNIAYQELKQDINTVSCKKYLQYSSHTIDSIVFFNTCNIEYLDSCSDELTRYSITSDSLGNISFLFKNMNDSIIIFSGIYDNIDIPGFFIYHKNLKQLVFITYINQSITNIYFLDKYLNEEIRLIIINDNISYLTYVFVEEKRMREELFKPQQKFQVLSRLSISDLYSLVHEKKNWKDLSTSYYHVYWQSPMWSLPDIVYPNAPYSFHNIDD